MGSSWTCRWTRMFLAIVVWYLLPPLFAQYRHSLPIHTPLKMIHHYLSGWGIQTLMIGKTQTASDTHTSVLVELSTLRNSNSIILCLCLHWIIHRSLFYSVVQWYWQMDAGRYCFPLVECRLGRPATNCFIYSKVSTVLVLDSLQSDSSGPIEVELLSLKPLTHSRAATCIVAKSLQIVVPLYHIQRPSHILSKKMQPLFYCGVLVQ